jgi:hypothetical protein
MATRSPSHTFVVTFLAPVLAWVAAFNGLSLWLEPVSGDLTRIGRWAERDFGARRPGDRMPIRRNDGDAAPPADVLVLGDSFSGANIWQTTFSQATALVPLTFSYWSAGSIARWSRWGSRQPARWWVLQVVEREVVPYWVTLGESGEAPPSPLPIAAGQTTGHRPRIARNPDYGYLAWAAWNHVRLDREPGRLESHETVVAPLLRADMFTCRRPDRLLYYGHDARKDAWRDGELAAVTRTLKAVDAAARGCSARLLLVVVPDKSTTYAPWLRTPAARPRYEAMIGSWRAAGLVAVDVLGAFRRVLPGTQDLYEPDDTHVGPAGYRLLAATVADAVAASGSGKPTPRPR